MVRGIILPAALMASTAVAGWAACTSPAGVTGEIRNVGSNVLKTCDGTNWKSLIFTTTATACTVAGEIKVVSNVGYYCNSSLKLVKMLRTVTNGACSPNNTIRWNSSLLRHEWCNAGTWYAMGDGSCGAVANGGVIRSGLCDVPDCGSPGTDYCSDGTDPAVYVNSCYCGSTCFPAGSMVVMADGTLKAIEDVQVGDFVQGRYGELNEVLALDRPMLADRSIFVLNGTHRTTAEHPHWTEEGPKAIDPTLLEADWGVSHPVILADGTTEMRLNIGLTRDVTLLGVGDNLVTPGGGYARLETMDEDRSYPPETVLYNFVLGGSHTFFVDGFLVTAWPREDDFDYDAWQPRV